MKTYVSWFTLLDKHKPFFILAPMEDVTDLALRQTLINFGLMPHVFFTEFINVEGVATGKLNVLHRITPDEVSMGFPTIAQLWGSDETKFYNAVFLVLYLGFWGIDLNMGCPVKKVVKKGLGAGLINIENNEKAHSLFNVAQQALNDFLGQQNLRTHWQNLIEARLQKAINYMDSVFIRLEKVSEKFNLNNTTKKQITQNITAKKEFLTTIYNNKNLIKPTISIKTRLSKVPLEQKQKGHEIKSHGNIHSFNNHNNYIDPWLKKIFSWHPDFITVHLRTAKEMSKVPAHYEVIAYINSLSNKNGVPWFVNGDVLSVKQGKKLVDLKHSYGVMIGRGIFKNPLIFTGYNPVHEFNCDVANIKIAQECKNIKQLLQEIYEEHREVFKKTFEVKNLVNLWSKYLAGFNKMLEDLHSTGKLTGPSLHLILKAKTKKGYQYIKNIQMLNKFRKMYKTKKREEAEV